MIPLAFSVQGEVEKYGAYVGIAAFIGLAILSLLYFSQAREVKRLREWAGRAPERAAEIEAQAVANAEAALREREAEVAAPEPVSATNGAPARVLRPEEIAAAAFARAAGVAAPAGAGLAPPEPPTEIAVQRAGERAEAGAEAASVAAPEAAAAATEAAPAQPAGPSGPDGPAADSPDSPAGPAADSPAAPASPAAPSEPGSPAAPSEPAADEPAPANGHREEVPPIPPAATPAARRGAAPPRPAAPPPRRPAPAAPAARRRPAAATMPSRDKRSMSTIAIIVGIGVLVLAAAGFAATQLLGSDNGGGTQKSAGTPSATASPGRTATSTPKPAATLTPAQTKVAVLNSTPIPGLAASTRDQLAGKGYTKGNLSTGNFTGPPRQQSVVMYTRRAAHRAAGAVAKALSIASVQAADSATEAQAQNKGVTADVIVIVGGDKSR
ncbi:MAG TPA: LytR C-terminal domain-containing protein [Solirubrobacteraceae bacterium]